MVMFDPDGALRSNLVIHAAAARRGMALTTEVAARLAGVDQSVLDGVEGGQVDGIPIGDLMRLALFLGLMANGTPRPPVPGHLDLPAT